MSPLWRNRLCIAVSPGRVSLLKLGRGLKPKVLGSHDEAVEMTTDSPWQAAVGRLAQLLAGPEWGSPEADIVLSNQLVQYATVTFNGQLKKYSEREAFARHILTQTHGPAAAQWELRIQKGREGMPWLVTAVDGMLLAALREACGSQKIKLRSIAPQLMAVFNRFRTSLVADPAWVVINEPGHSLLALLRNGQIAAVNGVSHQDFHDIPKLLDRENLVSGLPEPCRTAYLYTSGAIDSPALAGAEYDFVKLEPSADGGMGQEGASQLLTLAGAL